MRKYGICPYKIYTTPAGEQHSLSLCLSVSLSYLSMHLSIPSLLPSSFSYYTFFLSLPLTLYMCITDT